MDSQATFQDLFASRVRERAEDIGMQSMRLAEAIGVKRSSMSNYWSGQRPYPMEVVPALARELSTSVEWLFTGAEARVANSLRDAADAEWVNVPKYDLRHMTDSALGEPTMVTPMRKDWMATNFRTWSNVWLTRLPTDYPPADLEEGTLVLCRSIEIGDLAERHLCIWRFHTNLLIGRFSVVPDAVASSSLSAFPPAQVIADRANEETIVARSQIGQGDDHYHLVGRILGVFLRPV